MALRLVRQTSDTPNITNKDDVIMTRYAYGGYNGVVNGFGNECGYTAENGIFKILDGRIVVDGWEIDVDGAGWSFDFSNITGTQYHSVYAEINVATETVKIDSTYLTGSYPEITKGDDLTTVPNGTARLLLYKVKVENGRITEVVKKFHIIPYLADEISSIKTGLKDGTIIVNNASKVNNLEIKRDENSVLKIGDTIIPQKRLIWSGSVSGGNTVASTGTLGLKENHRYVFVVDGTPYTAVYGKDTSYYFKFERFVYISQGYNNPAISISFMSPHVKVESGNVVYVYMSYMIMNVDNNTNVHNSNANKNLTAIYEIIE